MSGIEFLAHSMVKIFENFTHGVRVQMIINRGVGNSNKGSKRWVNKLVSTNTEEFEKNLIKLINQVINIDDDDYRIYSSINPRSLDKAIKMFMHNQIDATTDLEKMALYKDIRASFVSSLMKPECRDDNLFLIDYDHCDIDAFPNIDGISIVKKFPSKSGWHIITKPFNPELLKDVPYVTIQKDALLLLYWR